MLNALQTSWRFQKDCLASTQTVKWNTHIELNLIARIDKATEVLLEDLLRIKHEQTPEPNHYHEGNSYTFLIKEELVICS